MSRSPSIVIAAVLLALVACKPASDKAMPPVAKAPEQPRVVAPIMVMPDAHDIHSYAEPATARVTHVGLDLVADFATRTLAGVATLDVLVDAENRTLTLDTKGLSITAVQDDKGQPLRWVLGDNDPILGRPLRIELAAAHRVAISYQTTPGAAALQWLEPAQTAGKQKPYLFSQGEAILTRTWIPTQDSPGIRQTWSARVVAPADLRVVMSGEVDSAGPLPANGGMAWQFHMDHPVAPYLMALAIGDITFQSLGPRTGVYAEPSRIAAAAAEFADIEALVAAAEALYGPYRWGRYDLLVLPPSFPFGGMENPRLTFATPTIIAGDKSLVNLVAHELAHSWSGNLVTNATWADFWLNEGFTVYFENRIMERVYGKLSSDMLADLGWDDLHADIRQLGGMQAADTRLHIDLAGRDPDDGMTNIPYEKGATLLRTIEAAVGRERWDAYLRDYFDRHAFQPQTSAGLLADLRTNLIKEDAALEQKLGLDSWVYDVGLPANAVHVKSAAFAQIDAAAKGFVTAGSRGVDPAAWNTAQRVRFLNRLPRRLTAARLSELITLLALDVQRNSEVRFAWLRLAIANHYDPALPELEDFLTSMGRRKFVLPLFTDLMAQGAWGKPAAERIYAKARPGYHSVTTGSVDKIVPLAEPLKSE